MGGMAPTRDLSLSSPALWADLAGVWASALCVLHCLLTPFLLSFSVVFAPSVPSEEGTHRSLALLIAVLGALALLRGFHTHRRARVLLLMLLGLSCIFAGAWGGNRMPQHWMEVAVTCLGSGFMISAHRLNQTSCRQCLHAKRECLACEDPPNARA